MQNDYGMYQGYKVETTTSETTGSTMNNQSINYSDFQGCPIYECPQERQIHKQIIHNVPQE